jgi:hypothetical protein
MFQTERWLVINDGQSIPIFVDGVNARRSSSGGFRVTVKNLTDTNVGTTYGPGTNAQIKSGQQFGTLYSGASCASAGGGGTFFAASSSSPPPSSGGGVPPATPPPTPPPTPPTTPSQPAPPAPPPTTNQPPAHWPWLPDNTNNWVPP